VSEAGKRVLRRRPAGGVLAALYAMAGIAVLIILIVNSQSSGKPAALGGSGHAPGPLTSTYVYARDGTPIALYYLVPSDPPAHGVPTLLRITRYPLAALDLAQAQQLAELGFAVVVEEERGTGASGGTWRLPWSPALVSDARDVLGWVTAQAWSDGRVATWGISYDGGAAEAAAASGSPAVRAAAPLFIGTDPYADIVYPGGVFNRWFMAHWTQSNEGFDAGHGYQPMSTDPDGTIFREAIREHRRNLSTLKVTERAPYRNSPLAGLTYAAVSWFSRLQATHDDVPEYGIDGWFDSAFARGALTRFLYGAGTEYLEIGPWNHGGTVALDPLRPGSRLPVGQATFEPVLRQMAADLTGHPPKGDVHTLRYFTLGEDRWHTASTWPPAGVSDAALGLSSGGGLGEGGGGSPDRYVVDRSASTGGENRWHTTLAQDPVRYGDLCQTDQRLLDYTSPPLARSVTVTGTPWAGLSFAANRRDASVFAYLEGVAPDGYVSYLTEGELRAEDRATSGFGPLGPVHPFTRKAARPLEPGRPTTLNLGLLPISARIPAGDRIRLALAGADAGTFATVPAHGPISFHIYHDAVHASALHLPVAGGAASIAFGPGHPLPASCPAG
jgi:uncharacterized protein